MYFRGGVQFVYITSLYACHSPAVIATPKMPKATLILNTLCIQVYLNHTKVCMLELYMTEGFSPSAAV